MENKHLPENTQTKSILQCFLINTTTAKLDDNGFAFLYQSLATYSE